jgi:hypothetical protein
LQLQVGTLSIEQTLLKPLIIVEHGRDGIPIEYPPFKRVNGLGEVNGLLSLASPTDNIPLEQIADL